MLTTSCIHRDMFKAKDRRLIEDYENNKDDAKHRNRKVTIVSQLYRKILRCPSIVKLYSDRDMLDFSKGFVEMLDIEMLMMFTRAGMIDHPRQTEDQVFQRFRTIDGRLRVLLPDHCHNFVRVLTHLVPPVHG